MSGENFVQEIIVNWLSYCIRKARVYENLEDEKSYCEKIIITY